jgi:hypothetical protein
VPLTGDDVACWLLKSARPPDLVAPGWAAGEPRRLRRCLRRSYRLELMVPGQRCLLWLSGRVRPGVHALGTVVEPPDPAAPAPEVEVLLHLLPEPVDRAELRDDPAFATAEVLRMPAGSNPSYLRPAELAAVLTHLDPPTPHAAGWERLSRW